MEFNTNLFRRLKLAHSSLSFHIHCIWKLTDESANFILAYETDLDLTQDLSSHLKQFVITAPSL